MQTLRKLMKSLRKPDTLTNYNERSYSCYQLESGEKAWRNPSFFSTIKVVIESYLQKELMTEYLRKKIKYDKLYYIKTHLSENKM